MLFRSALCPDNDVAPSPPSQCLEVKYAGLKIFVYFNQTTAKKKKNAVLGPEVAGFSFPLGLFCLFLRK